MYKLCIFLQEIEPSIGENLLKLWDKIPAYQPKVPAHYGAKTVSKPTEGQGQAEGQSSASSDQQSDSGRSRHWSGQEGHGSYGGQWSGGHVHYSGSGHHGYGSQGMGSGPYHHNPMYGPMGGHMFPGSPGQNMSPVMILQRGQGHNQNRSNNSQSNYNNQGHSYYHKGQK